MTKLWKKSSSGGPHFLVSIGAGINQMPLIKEAKALGFSVIGVDMNPAAPGFLHCDIRIIESIENFKEIFIKLKEFIVAGDITAVLSKSYGTAIKCAAYLAEQFNCTLLPFRRVDDFLQKERMKEVFSESGIPSPRFHIITDRKKLRFLEEFSFPLIVKPATGHAKKGVKLVNSRKELEDHLNVIDSGPVIIEEFIEGDEIIAAGLIHRGRYHLVEMTDKVLSPPPYFVDLMHLAPSRHFSRSREVREIGQKIADAFDIVTSPLIMEIKVHPEKGLSLIEAVPEFGGEFIPDFVIPKRTAYNFIAETIRAAAGKDFKLPQAGTKKKNIAVKYITGRNGIFTSFNPIKYEEIHGLLFYRIFKDVGSHINPPETNHDRIGVVITEGKSIREAVDACDFAIEKLSIKIRPGK